MDAYEFVFKLSLSPFYSKDSLKTNSYAYISVLSSPVISCGVRVTGFNNWLNANALNINKKARLLHLSLTVLHYTRLKRLARDKHSSLMDPFVSYKGYDVLWIQYLNCNHYSVCWGEVQKLGIGYQSMFCHQQVIAKPIII